MYGIAVILVMLVLRVVIPIGLLLWIGEIARRHDLNNFQRMSSRV